MHGVDRFIHLCAHQKKLSYGLLTNHACLSISGRPVALELLHQGFNIRKIFSPEHGVYSQSEDGLKQQHGVDLLTGLPVTSLYSDQCKPTDEDLEAIDILLVDLPNIGCRFYTYLWTITYALEACEENNRTVFVLDRRNQSSLISTLCEGPMLDEENCSSFLGRWKMPVTFGYSYGQLLKWFIADRGIDVDLRVVDFLGNQNLFTVPPSPAISDQQTIDIYPCTALFEGVNLSVGRGTSFPFRVIGAPWIDPNKCYEEVKRLDLPGLEIFPYSFKPMWSDYAGELCRGLYFKVTDQSSLRPVSTGLSLLNYFSRVYQIDLKPELYPTAVNPTGQFHLDRLLGITDVFSKIGKPDFDAEELMHSKEVTNWINEVNATISTSVPRKK